MTNISNFYKQEKESDLIEELRVTDAGVEAAPLEFLSPAQRTQAEAEWKQLLAIGWAGEYLARETLAWAYKHPEDMRVPEALHFAWRAEHFSCEEYSERAPRRNLSREIFQLLHNHYPHSPWTRKTQFWY